MTFVSFLERTTVLAAIAVPMTAFGWLPAAEARIKCVNGQQVVQGSLLSTPYCQDELVAQVAREHGHRVSGAAIRNNPNIKRDVCRFVGRDIRIQLACIDANGVGRRPF